jgi:hypothetical protein
MAGEAAHDAPPSLWMQCTNLSAFLNNRASKVVHVLMEGCFRVWFANSLGSWLLLGLAYGVLLPHPPTNSL